MFFGMPCMYVTYVYPHAFMFSGLYLILYFCACMYVDIPQAPLDEFREQQISDAGDSDLGVVDRT
jgi:hypothetical protein